MARMIDGDKLVENLRLIATCWSISPFVSKEKHNGAVDMLREVEREVKEAPTLTPPNEWVSVEERLPEGNGEYIVTACDEGCPAGEGIWYDTVVVFAEYYDGCWTWNDGTEYDLTDIVTHWMPLPAPPGKDNNVPTKAQNEPLNIEQLREMDGPVWVACKPIGGGNGYWCLCQRGHIITPAGSIFDVKEIPHWVFYRRPPEGEANV